jgi:hypothetical protein
LVEHKNHNLMVVGSSPTSINNLGVNFFEYSLFLIMF